MRVYVAHKGQALESLPVVILVDEGSASASEIVAAALHDHKRAMLVGTRTYGKGSVQNVIQLGDGEALKLTTARYYTPNDRPIEDRRGIMPDVYVPMSRDQLIALRSQEREDKLRNRYHLAAAVEGDEGPSPEAKQAPVTPEGEGEEKEAKSEPSERRGRVVDYQLKAAVSILKWQLAGPATAAK
jgi:carboxyl-terminal processing protease